MRADHKLEREVAAICDLPRKGLVALWVKAHGCPPPKGIKRGLLERSAAWHLQAKRLGGLSAHARRAIRQFEKHQEAERGLPKGSAGLEGSGFCASSVPVAPKSKKATAGRTPRSPEVPTIKPPPAPGTRLMREWNGRMHVVDITEDGILFDGKLYRSLTAVAKRITGTHWSGPRFFGQGEGRSMSEVAARKGTELSEVSRLLPLAFLAPNITEAIHSGTQADHLTAQRLSRISDLPLSWAQQLSLLAD